MLEKLWLEEERENKYFHIFLFAALFTALAIFVTHYFIRFKRGLLVVLITSLAATYPVTRYLREEEGEEEALVERHREDKILRRHAHELAVYMSFFMGTLFTFTLSSFVLPTSFYAIQQSEIQTINSATGQITAPQLFQSIIFNNLRVFSLSFLLSFLLSAGLIFILVWNSSVFGFFLAQTSKSVFHLPRYLALYLPHGMLEIAGYVLAGVSGALLSHHFGHLRDKDYELEVFGGIIKDIGIVFALGLLCILIGGVVEVF